MLYYSGKEIIEKYNSLYAPVFFEDYLLHIFNDENDYDMLDEQIKDEKIMLTMGHYSLLEKKDIQEAKYYYDKVTKLNSPLGYYSLAVYYYTEKAFFKAKVFAKNGIKLGCFHCAKLMFEIESINGDYELAEQYLLDEINNKVDKKEELYEMLCIFHLNKTKNKTKFFSYLDNVNSVKKMMLLAKYYYDEQDIQNLCDYSNKMISNKMNIGYYFMGLCEYKQFINALNVTNPDELLEILDRSQIYFEIASNDKLLSNHSNSMIERIEHYKTKFSVFAN